MANSKIDAADKHRPIDEIRADLDAAYAKHREIHPKVEKDAARVRNQAGRIDRAKARWKVEHPDEPFDPEAFNPPLYPIEPDHELNRKFHAAHYEIARFERELAKATAAL